MYSALKDGSSEAPKPNPFNTQVKDILETDGSGDGPSTRSNGANGLGVDGDMSCVNFENSDGTLDNLGPIRRDWELTSKLAIDLGRDKHNQSDFIPSIQMVQDISEHKVSTTCTEVSEVKIF